MDEGIRRVLPHNTKAEQAVIGSIFIDRNVVSEIADVVTADDFYNKQYGILYDVMSELYREGAAIDEVTVGDRLKTRGIPEDVCSSETIVKTILEVPTGVKALDYARIVQDKSILREMIKTSDNLSKDCYIATEKTEILLGNIEKEIFKLVQKRNGFSDFVPIKTITLNVLEEIAEAATKKGRVTGLSTGFIDLDNMLTGMHSGELLLIAARPAMGKTAFVLNIAHSLAIKHNTPVAMFSLEMSKEQLVSRMIAMDAMVDSKKMKLGDLSDDDWDKVMESADYISKAPLYIDDNSSISVSELRSKCTKLKQQYDIQLVVLDYLQLMSSPRAVENRQQFISEVSRAMKNLARDLKIPVIALSQLSRAVDSRPDHKPVLSDLRESGAIEQDSDVVMFIYRDEYYNPNTTDKPNTAEIIVAKQRNGETGSVDLRWLGKYTKFANPEH